MNNELLENLKVGTKIRFGKKYCQERSPFPYKEGDIVELVQGEFYHDNGLYEETQYAPAIWIEHVKDFDSIYHMFGNKLENFMDCEIVRSEV